MRLVLRLIGWVVGLAVVLLAIAFAVANRLAVDISLDPLPFAVSLPLYAVAMGALLLGIVLGWWGAWLRGGRWRRAARRSERTVATLEQELVRLRESAAPRAITTGGEGSRAA